MSIAIQRRRGATAEHAVFTGLLGEITVDTDKDVLVAHDGATAGGYPMSREVSNPNLLINADGMDPLDQRNSLPATSVATATYYADRWKISHGVTGQVDLAVQPSEGLRLTASSWSAGAVMQFTQAVEDFAKYQGKTLTLSASVKSNNANAFLRLTDGISNYDSSKHSGGEAFETLSVTATINGSASSLSAELFLFPVSVAGQYIEFEWIKLEVGSVATPFVADLPNINLAKCDVPNDNLTLHPLGYASLHNAVSNPNLLINADGTDPLDQRGSLPATSVASGAYAIDRWQVYHDATPAYTALEVDTGLNLSATAGWDGTYLLMEQPLEFLNIYKGATLTLSARVKSNNSTTKLFILDSINNTQGAAHSGDGNWETLTVTHTVTSSATSLSARLYATTVSSAGQYIEFEWIKLEEGSVATPFVADLPGVNLAKCKYYTRLVYGMGSLIGVPSTTQAVGVLSEISEMRNGGSGATIIATGPLTITDEYAGIYTQSSEQATLSAGNKITLGNFTGLTNGRPHNMYGLSNAILITNEL